MSPMRSATQVQKPEKFLDRLGQMSDRAFAFFYIVECLWQKL
jgi:hypothetical protein